ncbi:cation:proton antiporter domain-containing protein [Zophobihabitans entericus]|uniref:Portal protein n=1 Tax=Zophobihabitans entericus TaxID=1635327 RepID=A0A6G9I9I7_9GAMM|nr:cation:proton antiporter [Zophobihabitans entericus]QIQ20898.1 portal protein [Zophobihabitans entericus]
MGEYLRLLSIILFVAFIAVFLSKKTGLGSILGLLLTGVIIGPYTPGEVIRAEHVDEILHISEFGIVLLLFIIGLEMHPKRLWSMRKEVFGLGSLQILLSGAAIGGYFYLLGYTFDAALIVGLTLALSSTAFVIQILQERNEFSSEHGRTGFSILLMQDLAIVPLLALVPILGASGSTLPDETPVWIQSLATFGALCALIIFGKYVVPYILNLIAKEGYKTSFSLFVMLAVILAAYMMDKIGLSMALGAFIMGMTLSSSKYGFQIHASVESIKSLLMSLFFISVGMSINFLVLAETPFIFLLSVVVILLIKIAFLFVLPLLFGSSKETATKIAFLLCQGGEFGFVLFGAAKTFQVIDENIFVFGVGVISVTMALTPGLYALGLRLTKRYSKPESPDISLSVTEGVGSEKVIIAGYGDTGYVLAQMLKGSDIPFIVIEKNPWVVKKGRKEEMPVYYGDITDRKLLSVIGVEQAQMVIVAINHGTDSVQAISTLRIFYPELKILSRVLDIEMTGPLIQAGANWVVIETLESSLHIGSEALKILGVEEEQVAVLVDSLRKDEEHVIQSSSYAS